MKLQNSSGFSQFVLNYSKQSSIDLGWYVIRNEDYKKPYALIPIHSDKYIEEINSVLTTLLCKANTGEILSECRKWTCIKLEKLVIIDTFEKAILPIEFYFTHDHRIRTATRVISCFPYYFNPDLAFVNKKFINIASI